MFKNEYVMINLLLCICDKIVKEELENKCVIVWFYIIRGFEVLKYIFFL